MEAKGCAKPAVWKDARRYFYWALRAEIARAAAIANIAEASPASTRDYQTKLLLSLLPPDTATSTDNRAFAEAIEALDLSSTLSTLRRDHVAKQMLGMVKSDRKGALDGLVRVFDGLNLSEEERVTLSAALQNPTNRSPGPPGYST
jgi:acetyl-CoA carboxylase / biotin carboxylase 1